MQWIVLIGGLVLLFLLTRKKHAPMPRTRRTLPEGDGLGARLAAAAQQADGRGYARTRFSSSVLTRLERSISYLNRLSGNDLLPAARWLCENGRFLQEEAAVLIREHRSLPRLPRSLSSEPRICLFVREAVQHSAANLTPDILSSALAAWQQHLPMTTDELNALPVLLRSALLMDICDLAQQCEQDQRAQQAASQAHLLHKHGKTRSAQKLIKRYAKDTAFWEGLMRLEEPAEWMGTENPFWQENAEKLVQEEHDRQAENCRWIGNAVTSLRTVSRMPWHRLLEEASTNHEILKQDPVYQQMDEESRACYRAQAARIARRCRISERAVCTAAVSLCQGAQKKSVAAHVGFYLLDDGYPDLLQHLHVFNPLRRAGWMIRAHGYSIFRICSWLAFIAMLAVGFFSGYAIVILVPFALVFLYAAQQCTLRWLQNRLQPRMVPRMALERLEEAVLVVCPVMLMDAAHALAMVKRLSVMHEANPDQQLHFLLLGDFQDSLTATLGSDAEIITAASAAIHALCEDTGHPFFYMQRERSYSPGERTHHSRERKRGALETLLCLIQGRAVHDSFAFTSIDPSALRGQYRYVITLDSDTLLPPGSALRMIGAMQHPLQKRQLHDGRPRGVSILQPRMETAAHLAETPFSRLLGGSAGTDPYNRLTAEIDRDLFGSATFMGKGIIDPEPFLDATQGSIPEGCILSHDLLEGALAGCASAGDILLYDGQPQNLTGYLARLHRWTRGDWQLIPYLLPIIGYNGRRHLDGVSRFKIWRNLFRSLTAPLRMIVMLYAAFTGRNILLLASVILPEIPWLLPFSPESFKGFLSRLAVLPCEAWQQTDAIVRTLYRLFVTRQHLLDWTTAAQVSARQNQPSMLFFSLNMSCAGLFAALPLLMKGAWTGLFPALVWAAFPFLLPVLEQKQNPYQRPTEYMREVLMRLAKHTFTFFETAVTESDHGLPPDNVQIEPNKGIAHRTSPTNIGLYLCSLIASQRLGLISAGEMAGRMDETVHTLEALPLWHGLLYNWYDTQTLAPMQPAFVSSVDCGNLAVCLLTCAQGVRTLLPELDPKHHDLAVRLDRLCHDMQLHRLYDADADLFYIGVDTAEGTPSASHYDLLASESRLLSFVSIMLRQVPVKHWFRLGRQHTPKGALISYSGTMFEYMMPLLFQSLVPKTLLDRSCRQVLRAQGKRRLGGAFGVSESGYHAFDPALYYQYKAFGLPELALDADIQDNVLAPYASMLCMPLDLKMTFRNLQRLQQLGLEGPLGLFEAADFSSARTEGKNMTIVRSHMAHHQGMILCALCNALCEGYMADLFSALPRAQAYRLLLEERPDSSRSLIRHPLRRSFHEEAAPKGMLSRTAAPLVFPIDAHLLCGGETTLMIDAQGGGFLKHGDTMLTRFHESCHVPSGMRLYLRDSESGAYWTATDPYLTQTVQFEAAQAVFRAERFDIRSELRIWIDPLDGSCIHRLSLENTLASERMMEVCSYLEPALCRQQDDEAHPAFQNLFIQTERLDKRGVTVLRRSREPDRPVRRLWHLLSSETPLSMFRIQTDRAAFIGRGRSFLSPRAMDLPISAVADSLGDVIEPCVSLRGQFTLPPKGTAVFCFVTHMPDELSSKTAFCDRYAQISDVTRTYDSALTRSMVTARYLQLTESGQQSISRMTGAIAYRGQPGAFSGSNHQSVRSLWRFGISGDVPILLYTCCGSTNEPLLKLLLDAHALWRINGFAVDLIILVEECTRRAEVLSGTEALINASHCRDRQNQTGGVYLLNRLAKEDEQLLRSMARVTLSSGGGSLEKQLEERSASARARPLYLCRSTAQWKQQLPPVEDVLFSNGYGGFTPDGDYQITLAPGRQTPAPWCNPLCMPHFGTLAAESGLLFTCLDNSQQMRLTGWPNDSVTPFGEENFFLRDRENRLIWSLTRLPLGHHTTVRITHAPGVTTYESSGYGVYARMHCFTDAEETACLRTIHLQNESQTERTLTLHHTCRFAARGGQSLSMECTEDSALCFLPHADGWVGLCAVDPENVSAASMSAGLFQGLWSLVPFALSSMEQLPQAGGDTAILSYRIRLKPGEGCTLTTALVFGKTKESFTACMEKIRSEGATERLRTVRRLWEERLGILQFDLPDQALGFLLGRWLPYQTQASRLWMRAGFYQAGGAYGFRDQLQDQLALLMTHPDEVRAHLLRCAAHQFEEGDVQHWWHDPFYGVRTRISDDKLFLPYVACAYIEATKDETVLSEDIPYLKAPPLAAEEHDRLFEAEISETSESLLGHCLRAIDSVEYGAHDLPLMGSGDWNDGLNAVGGNNGESVWLGMFLCEVIRRFAPYCDAETETRLNERRDALLSALERAAWDGSWYLRGWYNDGSRLGSADSEECRIDLLPQSWAVLCGLSRERSEAAMESAWHFLYEKDVGLIKLFAPPFDGAEKPGYIAGYVPGVRENGGQYTHAACWAMAALHQLGQDERAWELLGALLPTNHAATRQLAARYRVEPYVLPGDVYANPQQRGRGGWTWYTGSAAWFQAVVIGQMLGLQKAGTELRFRPVVPEGWDTLRITYRFGSSTYHLRAARDCLQATADGKVLPDGILHLTDDGKTHEAVFPLRS